MLKLWIHYYLICSGKYIFTWCYIWLVKQAKLNWPWFSVKKEKVKTSKEVNEWNKLYLLNRKKCTLVITLVLFYLHLDSSLKSSSASLETATKSLLRVKTWERDKVSTQVNETMGGKRMVLGCNCPGNWVVRGRWKTGTAVWEISRKSIRV